jgi:hypothetical protein
VKIFYRPGFARSFKALTATEQQEVRVAQAQLSEVFGRPHFHVGIGVRRVGNYFEFRAGLKLRVLFVIESGDAVLVTVGNHDDIRRFIRENA